METMGWAVGAVVVLFVLSRLLVRGAPPKVVLQKIRAGASIIDVRSPEEFATGAYPGAVNIPLQSLAERLHALNKEQPVVVYCASGARSAAAVSLLKRAGFSDVLSGGGLARMP